jgi:hypothetical protein
MSHSPPTKPPRRHNGPKQVLPDLPVEAYADVPKNLPRRYMTAEQIEGRRLYDAQRQRQWRRKQAELRNRNRHDAPTRADGDLLKQAHARQQAVVATIAEQPVPLAGGALTREGQRPRRGRLPITETS